MKNKTIVLFSFLVILSNALFSQIAINTTGASADASAILDITASDKGLLIPRVSLSSIDNNLDPVSNPATGLMVYNITGNSLNPGLYMWNGASWSSMATMEEVINTLHGPLSANDFGEMFEYNALGSFSNISVPVAGSYYTWVTASAGDANAMTFDSSALIAENFGIYQIRFNGAIQVGLPNNGKTVEVALFLNGIRQDDLLTRCYFKETNKSYNISFSGLLSLEPEDEVNVRYTMDDNGTIRVETANLSLTKIN